ncbi:MAG: ATP phosphoribosyltransferase regulatory subunit [Pseudomonadota bacterium]
MSVDALLSRLEAASDSLVEPAVLQPLDPFVELAGEEFRKRLFATEGADGAALCLRPDFTIPVCLSHLNSHLQRPPGEPVIYRYKGTIFRKHRTVGSPEFEQAGTEWIGHQDETTTDAAIFALAMDCAGAVGLSPVVRIGDAHIFDALVAGLQLPAAWHGRLTAAFGDPARLEAAVARLSAKDKSNGLASRLAPALAQVDAESARAIVDAVVGLSSQQVTSRSADEIAEHILEQAADNGPDPAAAAVIKRFGSIQAPVNRAVDALGTFANEVGVDLSDALENFARRADAMTTHGIDTAAMGFEAAFGRRLSYYTGFVFEMGDPAKPGAEVIAGGRYDKLIALLKDGVSIPAVGFSVWLDRLPGQGTP